VVSQRIRPFFVKRYATHGSWDRPSPKFVPVQYENSLADFRWYSDRTFLVFRIPVVFSIRLKSLSQNLNARNDYHFSQNRSKVSFRWLLGVNSGKPFSSNLKTDTTIFWGCISNTVEKLDLKYEHLKQSPIFSTSIQNLLEVASSSDFRKSVLK